MRALFLLSSTLLLLAGPALADSVVLKDAVGSECYEGTLLAPSPVNNQRALAACNRAVASPDTDHLGALVNRSDVLVRMGRYEAAEADTEAALTISPNFAAAHLNRGAALVGLKRYPEAIAALDKAISLGVDKLHVAYLDRGMAREALNDIQGAYQDYKEAAAIQPEFEEAQQQLSRFRVVTH